MPMTSSALRLLAAVVLFAPFAVRAAFEDVTTERYPDADAVLVDEVCETAYNPDGTYVTTSEDWIKVLTEKGRQEEAVLTLHYSSRYAKSEFTYVGIIGTDGVEREVDVSATTKEMTDNSSESENIYDPMQRCVICTIPGLKVGEIVHYSTRRSAFSSRVENQFADMDVMEWTCPVLSKTRRILSPASRPLAKMAIRNPLGNVTESHEVQADGSTLHTWTVKNSPQAFPEPKTPPIYTLLQTLRVSTASDWRELSRWYWDLCVPHLEKTTPEMTNQVEAVGRDISRLYKWVAQEIRYMGLTLEDTSPGYAPHDVNVTFDNRYGVCRDKAGLLVAMLRIAGFEAFPVLIHNGAKMDDEVPSPYFNHAIVAVRAPGDPAANKDGFILMDPTDESSRELFPAYLSNCSYLVATPEGEGLHTSQVPSAEVNSVRVASKGVLEKDGSLVMETTARFLGVNDNAYRGVLLRQTVEERRKLFERIVRNIAPGAELISFEVSPSNLRATESELSVKLVFRAPESILEGETRDELAIPMLSRVLGTANWILDGSTALESRRFPLVVDSTAMVDDRVEIELGDAVGAPVSVPEPVAIDGFYAYSRSFDFSGRTLVATRRFAVNSVEFSPEEYREMRERVKSIEAAERERVVFAKDVIADADVRVRLNATDYVIDGPGSWTVTNRVVKEILTYNGKKSSSELKFAYNPLVKSVELVSATVSNPDGRIAAVGEKERNEFDCAWAASAPRYPTSKQLVVNLPSVEIGSVISYTVVSVVKDSPAPFRAVWTFDAKEPADVISVNFTDLTNGEHWSREVRNPRRIAREPMQPDSRLWRDVEIVTRGDFASAAKNLARAAAVEPLSGGDAYEEAIGAFGVEAKIAGVRNWMARHVRVAGPSLYEVPLDAQLTSPETVLRERYGTRLDYVRAMCAVLKGVGLDASVVFAATDAGDDPRISHMDLDQYPNVAMFATALCRVRVKSGGIIGFGAKTTDYFVGTENEYTPVGSTPYVDCHYIDPVSGAIELVQPSDPKFRARKSETYEIGVRENGAIDVDYSLLTWGASVGAFRKNYAEMLPEDRSRHFQELLGEISQAATATQDLVTDTESYPAKMTFSAFVPDYAVVADDSITLNIPMLAANLFPLTGSVRKTPIGIGAKDPGELRVKVVFPVGYTAVEHLPDNYRFDNPMVPEIEWYDFNVMSETDEKGRLVVTLWRETKDCLGSSVGRDYFALLKDWSRIGASRANRVIVVRRASGK